MCWLTDWLPTKRRLEGASKGTARRNQATNPWDQEDNELVKQNEDEDRKRSTWCHDGSG